LDDVAIIRFYADKMRRKCFMATPAFRSKEIDPEMADAD
jgi:hypothetical protein